MKSLTLTERALRRLRRNMDRGSVRLGVVREGALEDRLDALRRDAERTRARDDAEAREYQGPPVRLGQGSYERSWPTSTETAPVPPAGSVAAGA